MRICRRNKHIEIKAHHTRCAFGNVTYVNKLCESDLQSLLGQFKQTENRVKENRMSILSLP
jgi:hypothetical protein